jgi:hypothetical protein
MMEGTGKNRIDGQGGKGIKALKGPLSETLEMVIQEGSSKV